MTDSSVNLKNDLQTLKAELKRDIKDLETHLLHRIDKLSYQLTIRLGCMMVVFFYLVLLIDHSIK